MKKLLLFTLLVLICTGGFCADLKTVTMTLNSDDGIFHLGDEPVVSACSSTGQDCCLKMTVRENGVIVLERDVTLSAVMTVIHRQRYDEAVAVMVFLEDGSGNSAGIGYIIEPEQFRPGFPCPEDFKAFWDGELAAMRAVKAETSLTPVKIHSADSLNFICFALEISMHEGRPVRGYVAMPRTAAPGSLPIALFLHGAGVSAKSCRSSVDTAVRYAKYGGGCIAADINAHGMYNDREEQYYKDLENGELRNYRIDPPKGKREFYYRLMYLRDIRALDFLCSMKEWDGRHVLVTGSSQGGGQTCGVAGLDPRVGAIVPIVTGLSDEGARLVRKCGWTRHFRAMTDNPLVRDFYPYYDSCNFLRHTRAKVRMEVGMIDTTCAPEGMFAAFNVCASTDKHIVSCPYRRHSMKKGSYGYEKWRATIGADRDRFINGYFLGR